jgi:hypothetical protein
VARGLACGFFFACRSYHCLRLTDAPRKLI